MSLYLTIFDESGERLGWVLGHYSDFGYFRDKVAEVVDPATFPTLMNHSDCDGAWEPGDARTLRRELVALAVLFKQLPPEEPIDAFEHAAERRRNASSLYDCFHNVDGDNLLEALVALCDEAVRSGKPILFQ
jgi:hypothetical protein